MSCILEYFRITNHNVTFACVYISIPFSNQVTIYTAKVIWYLTQLLKYNSYWYIPFANWGWVIVSFYTQQFYCRLQNASHMTLSYHLHCFWRDFEKWVMVWYILFKILQMLLFTRCFPKTLTFRSWKKTTQKWIHLKPLIIFKNVSFCCEK